MKEKDLIKRIIEKYPYLAYRKIGFPSVKRLDDKEYSSNVKQVSDGFDFYDELLKKYYNPSVKDYNFTSGNPLSYSAFKPTINSMLKSILGNDLYKYPYSEGDDNVRKELLGYIKQEGFINNNPYDYEDIDETGLSIHNITLTVSTSHAFELILDVITRPYDVVIMTGPNYGLFSFKPERINAKVKMINLDEEDGYLINPKKLNEMIKSTNERLKEEYKDLDYVPKVVAYVNGNPCNPTGKVMGNKQIDILKELANVCALNDVFIIDDLIYRDITYDRANIAKPVASIPGAFKNTISLFGLSKSYGLASLRAGFVVADEVIIRQIINRIFQQMDAVPAIIGEALKGTFNSSKSRNKAYNKYFNKLNKEYLYRYNLLKSLVMGLSSINDTKLKQKIKKQVTKINKEGLLLLENGIDGVNIIKDLEPEAGFFVILDFTSLKNKRYNGRLIKTEEDLVTIFYSEIKLRFIMGKSIAWPNKNDLIGRFTYAKSKTEIINAFVLMHNIIKLFDWFENDYLCVIIKVWKRGVKHGW